MIHQFQCLACKGVYVERSADGGIYHHACPPLPLDKNGNVLVRADVRDENLTRPAMNRTPSIKSEGAGVKCLSDPRLLMPSWIAMIKVRVSSERAAAGETEDDAAVDG